MERLQSATMIIVRLKGGLGNQMFQYAAGRSLAHRLGAELKLDLSWFRWRKRRSFALAPFRIQATTLGDSESRGLRLSPGWLPVVNVFGISLQPERAVRFLRPERIVRLRESGHSFDHRIRDLRDPAYLDGLWQDERYFTDIRSTLLRDFSLRAPAEGRNLQTLEMIQASSSVSVHVRRGDYVSHKKTGLVHGIPETEYYRACSELLCESVSDPVFVVFSDDPEWARSNLDLPARTVSVTWNGPREAHEDLRLMTHCKHHIIANSTFSWWGAWLGTDRQKRVYAPRDWYRAAHMRQFSPVPGSWIKV